jgi:two-component sensor histidine kinase
MRSSEPEAPRRSPVIGFTRALQPARRLPLWARYLATVALVAFFFGVRAALESQLTGFPFLLFFPAIIVAGALFRGGAAVLAAALSVLASMWFLPPGNSFAITPDRVEEVTVFAVVAFACAVILEVLQLALERLNATVEALAAERDRAEAAERRQGVLLQELSHRIRNDLGALISLLRLQGRARPEAAEALDEAARRVRVLSRVHARLGQVESGGVVVDMAEFLTELGSDLETAHLAGREVCVRVEAAHARLPLERATAVGLVANELVTNAAKYAFPEAAMGTIRLSFSADGDDWVLRVEDDGVGPDAPGRAREGGGLGTGIVDGLARQLGGTFKRTARSPGTCAAVRFPVRT